MTIKVQVYNKCTDLVNEKVSFLQNTLRELTESAGNETKSTAGDKHETALAMLQIEQENSSRQLKEALAQKAALSAIDIKLKPEHIVNGSLIKTTKGYFFLSVPLGKITVDETLIIALSPQSPLGGKFLKLKPGDTAEMNGVSYVIEEIL